MPPSIVIYEHQPWIEQKDRVVIRIQLFYRVSHGYASSMESTFNKIFNTQEIKIKPALNSIFYLHYWKYVFGTRRSVQIALHVFLRSYLTVFVNKILFDILNLFIICSVSEINITWPYQKTYVKYQASFASRDFWFRQVLGTCLHNR